MDCGKGRGAIVEAALDVAGLTANKNTIPSEPATPFFPSGVRMGTPSVTTRGMKTREMKQIAKWISRVLDIVEEYDLPDTNMADKTTYMKKFKREIAKNKEMLALRKEVQKLCRAYPAPDTLV